MDKENFDRVLISQRMAPHLLSQKLHLDVYHSSNGTNCYFPKSLGENLCYSKDAILCIFLTLSNCVSSRLILMITYLHIYS